MPPAFLAGYTPPRPCLAPCPTCGQGLVLVRLWQRDSETGIWGYVELSQPLTPALGLEYECQNGVHTPLALSNGHR